MLLDESMTLESSAARDGLYDVLAGRKLQRDGASWLIGWLALLSVLIGLGGHTGAAEARSIKPGGPITFNGRAYAVETSGKGIRHELLADAGMLPPDGRARHMALLSGTIPNLVTAEMLHAATHGAANRSFSEASLADLNLTVGGHRVTARFVAARCSATVRDGRVYVAGRSEITGLAVNGKPVPVSGQSNQRLALPNGYLMINEQKSTISAAKGDLAVWALRVVIKDVANLSVGLAQAGLSVGAPQPCDHDFVTGSGWVADGQNRLLFSFSAGNRRGALEGRFNFVDPKGVRLTTTEVMTYTVVNPTTRQITGNLAYNGVPGLWYRLEVTDAGESGRDDQFTLVLGNTYAVRSALQGGNLTLFRCP